MKTKQNFTIHLNFHGWRYAAVLLCLVTLPSAYAVNDQTWNGSVSSDWDTAGNWTGSPGAVPGSGNTVIINSGTVVHSSATADQTRDFSFNAGSLSITGGSINTTFNSSIGTGSGTATVTVSTGATFSTNNTNSLSFGTSTSTGNLILSGGTVNTDVLTIRSASGATGKLQGYGTVSAARGASQVVNNGRIIADGGTLIMTAFDPAHITSTLSNSSNNGWYAINTGKITTKATPFYSNTSSSIIWGAAATQTKTTLDMVNSAAIAFTSTGVNQTLAVSLLANDNASAHAAPSGISFIGYWTIAPSSGSINGTDLAVRYDDVLAGGSTPTFYKWGGSSWASVSTSIDSVHFIADYSASSFSFGDFALGITAVPEPSTWFAGAGLLFIVVVTHFRKSGRKAGV